MLNRAALALALVVSIIFLSSGAFAAVFSYRQEIAVENKNPSDMIDYQTNIILDTAALLADDKISLSCADVRFADSPSYNSVEWKNNFPFWVDENSCGTSTTSFWVKVDKIHAGGKKTIYVYYGSDEPQYGSSGEKTFDFYQDFDNQDLSKGKQPDFWTDEINGDASVIGYESYNGKYSMQIESDMRSGYYTAFRENIFPSANFTLEAEVFPLAGAVLGIETDLHNPLVQFGGGCGSSISSENWGYYSSNRGWNTNSRFDNWNDAGSYAPDSWHNLKIIYRTNQHDMSSADFYLDSNAVAKNIVQPIGALDKLKVYGDVDCSDVDFGVGGYIDTIRVRKFSEVEPKVSVASEEKAVVVVAPAYSAVLRDWYTPGDYNFKHSYQAGEYRVSKNAEAGKNYYSRDYYIFSYVLIYPNKTESILNVIRWDSETVTSYENITDPYYPAGRKHYYSSINLTEQKFKLDVDDGKYRIELRQKSIPALLTYKNPKQEYSLQDVLNNWSVENLRTGYVSYVPSGTDSIQTLCGRQNPDGNIFLKMLYYPGRNQGTTDFNYNCWTANLEYVEKWCQFSYFETDYRWQSTIDKYFCWIERNEFSHIKVSDLPQNIIWSTEFDVEIVPAQEDASQTESESASSVSPFVLAGGAGDEKNPSQNNSSSSSALPLLAATAAGAAGLYLYGQRKNAKIILKNFRSGFTDFAREQMQKTKRFFNFLGAEKNGYWIKKYQAEQEALARAARERSLQQAREANERALENGKEEWKKAVAQRGLVDEKKKQDIWASTQANKAIEMLNSGKGDAGWFKQRMQYLAKNSGSAELAEKLNSIYINVREPHPIYNNDFVVVKYQEQLPPQQAQKPEGLFGSIFGGIKSGLGWFGKNIVKPAADFVSEKIIQPVVEIGKKIYHAATELPLIGGAIKFVGENIVKPVAGFIGNLAGSIGSAVSAAAGRVENIFQSAASAVDGALNYVAAAFVPKSNFEEIKLDGGGIIIPAGVSGKIKNDSPLLTQTKEFFSQWREDNKTNLEKQKEEEQKARDERNLQRRISRLKDGGEPNDAMDWKLLAQMYARDGDIQTEEKQMILNRSITADDVESLSTGLGAGSLAVSLAALGLAPVDVSLALPLIAVGGFSSLASIAGFKIAKGMREENEPRESNNFLGDTWSGITGALAGAGKMITGTIFSGGRFVGDVLNDIKYGDLRGAGVKLWNAKEDAKHFVGDVLRNHGMEILGGVGVGALIVAGAPVVVPVIAASLGVSSVAAAGGLAAAGLVAAGGYAISNYGPKLNKINQTCDWSGNGESCGAVRSDVAQDLVKDATIVGGSLKIGLSLGKKALEGRVVDNPKVVKAAEAFLNRIGVKVVRDDWAMPSNQLGAYNLQTKQITYDYKTRVGDFFHEVKHAIQHAKAGFPKIPDKVLSEIKTLPKASWSEETKAWYDQKMMREKEAYQQDFDNAAVYGYESYELNEIKQRWGLEDNSALLEKAREATSVFGNFVGGVVGSMKNLFVIDSKVPEPTAEKTEVEVGYALPTGIDEIPPFIFWGGVGKSAGKKVVKEVAEEVEKKLAESLIKKYGGDTIRVVERDGIKISLKVGSFAIREDGEIVGKGLSKIIAKHGEQFAKRGIKEEEIDKIIGDVIRDGVSSPKRYDDLGRPYIEIIKDKIKVIINPEIGEVITARPM